MKKIVYSPDAADKLRAINRAILIQYGSQKSKQIVGKILKVIRGLALHEEMGASVSAIFGIDSELRQTA
ncbi:MAG: type II toxin-antitoxin system RelE/ParE family toxin [Firmicutes bacterium]|nr:type II toxin-antitoxin system RelE/ParE family toxin [Bacillota bacterium]